MLLPMASRKKRIVQAVVHAAAFVVAWAAIAAGQLLIAPNDDEVVFLDVPSMISGKPDPVVGHLSDGQSAGSCYANVTKDDAHLCVRDEYAETITVIDLAKARRTNYDQSAIVG